MAPDIPAFIWDPYKGFVHRADLIRETWKRLVKDAQKRGYRVPTERTLRDRLNEYLAHPHFEAISCGNDTYRSHKHVRQDFAKWWTDRVIRTKTQCFYYDLKD